MNNVAKGAAGLASAGTICTGGYFACKHYVFSSDSTKQNIHHSHALDKVWKTLDASNANYANETVGKIYGGNLLDPFDESNEDKWKELHQKMVDDESAQTKEITSLSFQASSISYPFRKEADSANSALNKVCKQHYDKPIENNEESSTSKMQIGGEDWKALWMLCSQWNPKMLDANSYQENSIGKIRSSELLSTVNQDNEELWKKKNQDFFGLKNAPAEETFKKLYEDNKDTDNSTKLKNKCEEIYKSTPTSGQENSPTAEEVVKYCSMKVIDN